MSPALLHRHRQPWALALLLAAVLLFTGWGQVHRVLHPGTLSWTAAEAVAQSASPSGLADEDGSSLCQLLDHLSHGAGLVTAPVLVLPSAAPLALPVAHAGHAPVAATLAFEARGPPRLT